MKIFFFHEKQVRKRKVIEVAVHILPFLTRRGQRDRVKRFPRAQFDVVIPCRQRGKKKKKERLFLYGHDNSFSGAHASFDNTRKNDLGGGGKSSRVYLERNCYPRWVLFLALFFRKISCYYSSWILRSSLLLLVVTMSIIITKCMFYRGLILQSGWLHGEFTCHWYLMHCVNVNDLLDFESYQILVPIIHF